MAPLRHHSVFSPPPATAGVWPYPQHPELLRWDEVVDRRLRQLHRRLREGAPAALERDRQLRLDRARRRDEHAGRSVEGHDPAALSGADTGPAERRFAGPVIRTARSGANRTPSGMSASSAT